MTTTHRGTEAPRKKVCRVFSAAAFWLGVSSAMGWLSPGEAQQLLDRIVARVGTASITQTDVDAALAFGVVERGTGAGSDPLQQLIDRRLMLTEVNRFPPPEPADAAVLELLAKMKSQAGDVAAVMKRTGADDKRLTELARDTLRIQAYIAQRFGSGPTAVQRAERWVEDLRARGDVTVIRSRP